MEPLFERHLKLTCLSSIAPQVWGKFLRLYGCSLHLSRRACSKSCAELDAPSVALRVKNL